MLIRRATLDDLPHLMALAHQEHEASRFASLPFNEAKAAQSFTQFIEGMATVVFVSAKGFIAGCIQPMLFNRYWNAYEMCWFALDGSGMALLKALRKWAKAMSCDSLVVHNYAGIVAPEKFTRVMGRMGFKPIGATYSTQLGDA